MIITSKDNPIIKQASKLSSGSKARKREQAFVAEGLRLCRDVMQNHGKVRTAFMTEDFLAAFPREGAMAARAATHCYRVSDAVMRHLSDTDSPQGILCVCEMPVFGRLPDRPGRYVLLEQVADPANVGAIARTAEALGIDGLLLAGGCDVYHPKSLRASMGALVRLPVYQADMESILTCMRQLQVPTYAAVVDRADSRVTDIPFGEACAVVIGNEANGITAKTAAACTGRITIPMAGRAESLNAAAAACILIWEMTGRGGKA